MHHMGGPRTRTVLQSFLQHNTTSTLDMHIRLQKLCVYKSATLAAVKSSHLNLFPQACEYLGHRRKGNRSQSWSVSFRFLAGLSCLQTCVYPLDDCGQKKSAMHICMQ